MQQRFNGLTTLYLPAAERLRFSSTYTRQRRQHTKSTLNKVAANIRECSGRHVSVARVNCLVTFFTTVRGVEGLQTQTV